MKRAAVLLGFGGPTAPAEVRPFVESVLEGVRIPPARFDAVLHHYDAVGGASPYNEEAGRLRAALEAWFAKEGRALPVRLGFRHSTPSFKDVFSELAAAGVEDAAAFVLSPLRSYSSFDKYRERADKARAEAGGPARVRYAAPFHDDPLFIGALADRIRRAIGALAGRRTLVLFSAHSIPQKMDDESGYARQFREIARLAAARAGLADWSVAYQSRSGRPEDPWLSPDVPEAIRAAEAGRFDAVLLVPAGFLCENVEILYDLDVEARAAAEEKGLLYARAETVLDHPLFTELVGRRLLAAFEP